MTKQEILDNCTWDRYDMASLEIQIPILQIKAKVDFIPEVKSGRLITDQMTQALNDVINLDINQITQIRNYLFWYFNLCCEVTYYGFELDLAKDQTTLEANKEYFGVQNPQDAWEKSKLEFITIEQDQGRAVTLQFEAPWDNEHGCVVNIINGEIEKPKRA